MQDPGLPDGSMQVVNFAVGSGVAFAKAVNKRNDNNDLIIATSAAISTRLAQDAFPGNPMDQVRWVASIGADCGVIAVSTDSALNALNALTDLLDAMKNGPTSISLAGGPAVGIWDHLKVLIAANAYGTTDVRSVKYIVFDGGGKVGTQLLAESFQAFSSGFSEANGFVGFLLAIGYVFVALAIKESFCRMPSGPRRFRCSWRHCWRCRRW